MILTNYLVIVVTAVVAYLLSSLYYFGFNKRIRAIRRQYLAIDLMKCRHCRLLKC